MSEELKPANQHPDFGKHCKHGQLKRKCYLCELEEENSSLRELARELLEGLGMSNYTANNPNRWTADLIKRAEEALSGGEK